MNHSVRLVCVVWLLGTISTSGYAEVATAQLTVLKATHLRPSVAGSKQLSTVTQLTFSADGSRLLSVLYDSATLWNLATRKPAGFDLAPRRQQGLGTTGATVISINGGTFFVADEGKGIMLRDVATGATRGAARFPRQAGIFPIISEAVISRDGKWMACAFTNHPWGTGRSLVGGKPVALEPCKVILFDTRSGAPRHTWTPKTKEPIVDKSAGPQAPQDAPYVFALEFSPDGHYLATATIDGNVTVYDTAGGREVGFFNEWDERRTLAPTPLELHQDMFTWMDDSRSLIMPSSLRHETPCWTVTSKEMREVRWPAETLTAAGDAPGIPAQPSAPARPRPHLPTPSEQMRQSREHLTGKPEQPGIGGRGGEIACKAFSADGRYAVCAFTVRTDGNPLNNRSRISIADLVAGRNLGSIHGVAGAVTFLRFSPDGKKVAWGTTDASVYVCPVAALIAMAAKQQQIR